MSTVSAAPRLMATLNDFPDLRVNVLWPAANARVVFTGEGVNAKGFFFAPTRQNEPLASEARLPYNGIFPGGTIA